MTIKVIQTSSMKKKDSDSDINSESDSGVGSVRTGTGSENHSDSAIDSGKEASIKITKITKLNPPKGLLSNGLSLSNWKRSKSWKGREKDGGSWPGKYILQLKPSTKLDSKLKIVLNTFTLSQTACQNGLQLSFDKSNRYTGWLWINFVIVPMFHSVIFLIKSTSWKMEVFLAWELMGKIFRIFIFSIQRGNHR